MTEDHAKRFAIQLAVGAAVFAVIPFLLASQLWGPAGGSYLGVQYNVDDHMVYGAWMRQAMEGRFLFDNRFAVDPQPGLTINVYFFLLGLVAKVTGIPLAMTLARAFFSGLFVWLAYKLIARLTQDIYTIKLALSLVVFGAGTGFLVWHTFGNTFSHSALEGVMLGRLPTDVWQPEGFIFPSMLTNGLFMVSMCLIVGIFLCVLQARESWRPVGVGAALFLVLMNIHSYDALLIALVLVAFLAMSVASRSASGPWILRVCVMGLGALPAAAWFMHVLQNDPVFQARAATETFSPNFRQIVFGYLLLLLLGFAGFWLKRDPEDKPKLQMIGAALVSLLLPLGFWLASDHVKEGYWMGQVVWVASFVTVLAGCTLMARREPAWNLVAAWGLVGLIAPYFPALFQRKLLMGLAAPWAILAALGLAILLQRAAREKRNLATILGLVLIGVTSLRWVARELMLARTNTSNTTRHRVYRTPDVDRIIEAVDKDTSSRKVLVAMPGVSIPGKERDTWDIIVPDWNPILSAFTGVYTYAGHWSETPDYLKRRGKATRLFLAATSVEERQALLNEIKPNYIMAPKPEVFGNELADLSDLGEVVVDGSQFKLIKL